MKTIILVLNIALVLSNINSFHKVTSYPLQYKQKLLTADSGCKIDLFKKLFQNSYTPADKYQVTDFCVTTKDGYILRLFRVNLSDKYKQKLPESNKKNLNRIVQLQHGVADSSDGWFFNKEDHSTGFYLVQRGFDVWVGNNRGNKYSHKHTNKKISNKDFYDYTFVEMGKFDMPAMYKFILDKTKSDGKIIYIGHSQGTSQMFSGLLEDDTGHYIQDKTEIFIAQAPVVFMNYQTADELKFDVKYKNILEFATNILGVHYLLPAHCEAQKDWIKIMKYACDHFKLFCNFPVQKSSEESFLTTMKMDNGLNDTEAHPCWLDPKYDTALDDRIYLASHFPSGTSSKTMIHWAQLMSQPKISFQKYDYGSMRNLLYYKSVNPPEYDLTKIKTKVALVVGKNDIIGTPQDVHNLSKVLNKETTNTYTLENYNHLTFVFPRYAQPLFDVYDKELGI